MAKYRIRTYGDFFTAEEWVWFPIPCWLYVLGSLQETPEEVEDYIKARDKPKPRKVVGYFST